MSNDGQLPASVVYYDRDWNLVRRETEGQMPETLHSSQMAPIFEILYRRLDPSDKMRLES